MLLIIAALLITITSLAHSYLGERYLVQPTLASGALPKLLGSQKAAGQTLRATWHLLSLVWMAIAVFLIGLQLGANNPLKLFYGVMAVTFAIHTAIPLVFGKGRHKSWLAFLGITVVFGWLALPG